MPTFQGKTLSGNPIDSNAFRGRPLVVSFFAPRCSSCDRTLVATKTTYDAHDDVTVVGIFHGDAGPALKVTREHGLKFPVAVDPGRVIAGRFEVDTLPATFVVDRGGWVTWVGGADMTEDTLKTAVSAAR